MESEMSALQSIAPKKENEESNSLLTPPAGEKKQTLPPSRPSHHYPGQNILKWILLGIRMLLFVFGSLVALFLVLGRFPGLYWKLDQFSHFVPQYAFLLGGVILLLFLLGLPGKRFLLMWILLPFWCYSLYLFLPHFLKCREGMEMEDPGKTIFRLRELNVMCDYSDRSDLAELVSGEEPDFIVFTEYSPSAHRSMSEKEISKYPWHYEIYDGDHTGIGVFSRYPAEFSVEQISEMPIVRMEADCGEGEGKFTLFAFRATSPRREYLYHLRNEVVRSAETWASALNTPAMMTGDFNATAYSPLMRLIESRGKMRFGASPWLYTWPALKKGWSPFLIQIDHCMVNDGIRVLRVRRCQKVKSDHYPVLIEFQIKE